MLDTNEMKLYPKKIGLKIDKMLFMYNDLDKYIKEITEEIIYCIDNSAVGYLKSLKQDTRNLDWAVMRLSEDRRINEYKKWKKLLESYISKLYDMDNKIYYNFVLYYYISKYEISKVMKILKINIDEFYDIRLKIKKDVYLQAVEEGIFRKEVKHSE